MSSNVVDIFESYRPQLLGLAYRITGSIFEAQDIVQEAFLKWANTDHKSIQVPYAWLVTATTRMSLDHLKSARVKRESYIGPWLPEPFITEGGTPEKEYELDQSITMALLILLEQLSASERATFILHDLFHFDFDEVGAILGKTGTACRKLASRARGKINKAPMQPSVDKEEHLAIVSAFLNAVKEGDLSGLVALLQENVVFHADGGGKAIAARKILQGLDTVATFLINVVTPDFSGAEPAHTAIKYVWFNGTPGFVVWVDTKPVSAFNFEIEQHLITKIHALRNPDKLKLFESG